jgi:Uma2 family endonuclease
MIAPHKQRVTQSEFNRLLAQPEYADRRIELWDGEIVEKMPKPRHSLIIGELFFRLRLYLQAHPIGTAMTEAQIELPDEDYAPVPDMCFVANDQGEWDKDAALPWMPALIVEVQSPGQSDQFMRDKADYSLKHGCKQVVTVYLKPIIEVRTATTTQLLVPGDALEFGDLLPGFSLHVADLLSA